METPLLPRWSNEPSDDNTVWSAGYHAQHAIEARLDVIDLFCMRHVPSVRLFLSQRIDDARYHEAKRDAIAAGLPLVI